MVKILLKHKDNPSCFVHSNNQPINKVEDKYKLLFDIRRTDFNAYLAIVKEIKVQSLDFDRLISFLQEFDSGTRNGARDLLLRFFAKDLDYDTTLTFLESVDPRIRERAHKVLILFPQKLNMRMLFLLLESKHEDVRRRVLELLKRVPEREFDKAFLSMRLESNYEEVRAVAAKYLMLHHARDISYETLIKLLDSRSKEVCDMAKQIIKIYYPSNPSPQHLELAKRFA